MVMRYILISVVLFCSFFMDVKAQNVGDFLEGEANGIIFKFKLLEDGTLGLVGNNYEGEIIVPETICIDNVTYTVTALCGDEDGYYYAGDNVALAFNRTDKVTKVVLPETLVYIGGASFWKTPITELVIPNSVSYLGGFYDLDELREFVCPDSQETFERYTINKFDKLESVVFGKNLKKIDSPAFDYIPMLRKLKFQTEVPPVLIKDPFDQCGVWDLSKITAYVPKGCIDAYKKAWPDFEFTYKEYDMSSISVKDGNVGINVIGNIIEIVNTVDEVNYELYDLSGKMIAKGLGNTIKVCSSNPSLYILKIGNICYKVYIY